MTYGFTKPERRRYCPDDRSPLEKYDDRGVVVDRCTNCGIIVLDNGELQAIIAAVSSMQGFHPPAAGHHRSHHHHTSDGLFDAFF